LTDGDLDLTESFGEDSAEWVLFNIQGEYALRALGERFRTDRGANPNYQGPWLDIFEMIGIAKSRANNTVRQKHVVFDSQTKLLQYVRYQIVRGSAPVVVQTEWSGWRVVNGQAIPGRVARRENGAQVWSYSQTQTMVGPAQADGAFHN
jgi:hypothetical protein